jgi:hypothetical protein
MRFVTLFVVLLVGLLTACAAEAESGNAPLPADVTIQEVHTKYEWYGWGSQGYTMDVECDGGSCTALSTCSDSLSPDGGETVTYDPVTVPAENVYNLRIIVPDSQPVDAPQEVIDHTDDYPRYEIVLLTSEGETLTVTSTSNTPDNIPWNLQRDGQWYVDNGNTFATIHGTLVEAAGATACWDF